MSNYCMSKAVFCDCATYLGFCCLTACMKKPDNVEVLSLGDAKIIGSDEREYVQIVRCKDCKRSIKYNDKLWCDKLAKVGSWVETNWFCADGEPKGVIED